VALATFVAFAGAGLVPLLVYLIDLATPGQVAHAFFWSALLTGAAFFAVGAAKSRFVEQPWYLPGSETLAAGGTAAALGYAVGRVPKQVVEIGG
jgi:VIT1/CCC1 family predicted Fe2+/Mn2+ transporter